MKTSLFVTALFFSLNSFGGIKTEKIEYKIGSDVFSGSLSYNSDQRGKRPGILVIHEWWGHNEHSQEQAERLAKMGYTAFALDMYGKGKRADHPKKAGEFATQVTKNMPEALKRIKKGMEILKSQKTVDTDKIAAIGYCFGGGMVLNMARNGFDVDAVVSFHGSLKTATPAKKGAIKAEVLVLNGEADPMVTAEHISAFQKEMKDAGAKFRFVNYPGAKHAFTNKKATELGKKFNIPIAYQEEADKESWLEMTKLFSRLWNER